MKKPEDYKSTKDIILERLNCIEYDIRNLSKTIYSLELKIEQIFKYMQDTYSPNTVTPHLLHSAIPHKSLNINYQITPAGEHIEND